MDTIDNQEKNQQDILQRIEQRLNVVEERATALLSNIDPDSMTPAQRVTAANRLLRVTIDLLKLRKQCTVPDKVIEQSVGNLIHSADNAIVKLMKY